MVHDSRSQQQKPPNKVAFEGYGSYVEKIIYNLAMASVEKGISLM